jgi:YidC/Oxa1 family membrane protein insertase
MLDLSVDLKGAAFLWMPDLSLKDPIYLTPILTGLSMYGMQKMMPAAPDPAQQRMLMMMPLLITTFSALAPAGLNVYWFVSNLFAMGQQGLTMAFAPHLFPKPRPER